ncbi:multicopper oxidase-domain-containing protein [Sporodiniella umbellata]|nr:multicopper oxidase-domain-containing protein [Sporodiniella umbellata]
MQTVKTLLLSSLLLQPVIQAALHQFELAIDYHQVNPDCHEAFSVPTVNGKFPAPTLYVTEGDEVEILVKNEMDYTNASIHYHGIRQIGSTVSDGVPGVTQDAIQPGETFLQRFKVTQAGTYFYHAHVGLQDDSVQGALIVYESDKANPELSSPDESLKAGPYSYQKDLILQLSEWWHEELESREDYYMGSAFTFDHGANSILINGNSINDPTKADQRTCKGYTTFDVEPNAVYRLRIIGGNTFRTLALGIKDHNMTIIEVDGELVHPFETNFLEVTPGQRFSVLLKTGDFEPGETFAIGTGYLWRQRGRGMTENGYGFIRYVEKDTETNHDQLFKPLSKWFEKKKEKKWGRRALDANRKSTDPARIQAHEILEKNKDSGHRREMPEENHDKQSGKDSKHPSDAPPGHGQNWKRPAGDPGHHGGGRPADQPVYHDLPTFPRRDTVDWIWHKLRPLAGRDPILDETDIRTIRLYTTTERFPDNTSRYLVNDRMNLMRDESAISLYPYLQERSLDVDGDEEFYTDLNTYRLGYNETVDLVFQNTLSKNGGCMLHPWHTHGHSHYVIASGQGEYVHSRDSEIRNFKHPLYKDTSVAYPSYAHGGKTEGCGWTKVRIKADNPGFWAVHCHVTTHMMQGKMVVLEEAPEWIERTSLY